MISFHPSPSLSRLPLLILSSGLSLALLTGCALDSVSSTALAPNSAVTPIDGRAKGGEIPIAHALVTLYATGTSTSTANGVYTGTATVLGPTTTTDANGDFSFNAANYTCPTNQIVYATIYGGNTGAGTNNYVLLTAVIGQCGSLNAFTDINELSSLATAYAFSGFMTIDTSGTVPAVNIVAPTANASFATSNNVTAGTVTTASGLLHAYLNAINLVDTEHGMAYAAPPSNAAATAPNTVINTLGNILQYCVNSPGGTAGDGSNCGNVFSLTSGLDGTFPTNTLQAALNLARNPYVSASNVTSLFNLSAPQTAFAPVLSSAPKDWTLAISYPVPPNPVSGIGFPFDLALDADDQVYVTSPENDVYLTSATSAMTYTSISACLFGWTSNGTLRPTITPYSGTPGTPGNVGTGTPGNSSWFCSGQQAATPQVAYLLTQLAPDAVGNIWISNVGVASTYNTIVEVSNQGAYEGAYHPTAGYRPIGVAVDKFNNVFYNLFTGTGSVANIQALAAGTGGTASTGSNLPIGTGTPNVSQAGRYLAFDSLQNLAISGYAGTTGTPGALPIGGSANVLPISGTQGTVPAPYSDTVIKKGVNGGSYATTSTTNNGIYGVAIDSNNNEWYTSAGAPGQTPSGSIGLAKMTPTGSPVSNFTAGTALTTGYTSPKFDEADGNNVIWVMDTTGIIAYASTASPTIGMLAEPGGFNPCIVNSGTTCTYPDNASAKGIAIDSTGSVWWTTPDLTTTNANSNRLIQMIGTAAPTWPLLAAGKPGKMPQ